MPGIVHCWLASKLSFLTARALYFRVTITDSFLCPWPGLDFHIVPASWCGRYAQSYCSRNAPLLQDCTCTCFLWHCSGTAGRAYNRTYAQAQRSLLACAGLLHTDFMHLAGSLLPWAALAFVLETNYGSVRVVLLWFVTLLGAAFTSAVLDSACKVVKILLQQPYALCLAVLQHTESEVHESEDYTVASLLRTLQQCSWGLEEAGKPCGKIGGIQ